MPIFLFAFLSSSVKFICICRGDLCKDNCPIDSLQVDSHTNSFYKAVLNYIGRDKHIIALIGADSEENDFSVDIRLSLFIDRTIDVLLLDRMFKPSITNLVIDSAMNYKFTSLNIKSLDVYCKFLGKINSAFTIDKMELDCNILNPNEDYGIYSIQVNELSIRPESIVFFKSISMMNKQNVCLYIYYPSDYFFVLYRDKISVFVNGKAVNITISESVNLFIKGNPRNSICALHLDVSDETMPDNIPFINISNVANIYLHGNWEGVNDNNLIIGDIVTIFIFTSYLPFSLNANEVGIFIDRNLTIPTRTNTNFIAAFANIEHDTKLLLYFKYLTCFLDVRDARIDILIDTYEFAINDPRYPITITISDTTMTHIIVNDPRFYKSNYNILRFVSFRTTFKNTKSIDDIPWIHDRSNAIMRYPAGLKVNYYIGYSIIYTTDSVISVEHVRHFDNILYFQTAVSGNYIYVYLSIIYVSNPNNINVMCTGSCAYDYQILNDMSDLNATELFNGHIYSRYDIIVNRTRNDIAIGLHNLMIDHLNFSLFCFNANIDLKYRNSTSALHNLEINNCGLVGNIDLYSKNVNFRGIRLINNNIKVSLRSEIVSVDEFSFEIIRRSKQQVRNLQVSITNWITNMILGNDLIQINREQLEWRKFQYLTFNMYSCTIENHINGKLFGFWIILSGNSDIILTGDWSTCEITDGINIGLNSFNLNLVFFSPYFPPNIKILGPGSYTIILDYQEKARICVHDNKPDLCYNNDLKLRYEQFIKAEGFKAPKLTIFNQNNVEFISFGQFQQIAIIPADDLDMQLSRFKFEGISVFLGNDSNNESDLIFSTLELVNSHFVSEEFKQMKLVVRTLICEFTNLIEFKDIAILSNIELSSPFVDEQRIIEMPSSGYSEILMMVLDGRVELSFGNLAVTAGGITFFFKRFSPQSLNIILLRRTSLTNICLENTKTALETVMFSPKESAVFFVGDWTHAGHHFSHEFHGNLNLFINGNINYYVFAFAVLDVHATAENVALMDTIVFNHYPKKRIELLIGISSELGPDTLVNVIIWDYVSLTQNIYYEAFTMKSPTVHVRVKNIYVTVGFCVANTMSNDHCSSI